MDFSEEEIKERLKQLGYINIPNHKLKEFMKDLQLLVQQETFSSTNDSLSVSSEPKIVRNGPKAFCKEKVLNDMRFSEEKENFLYESCSNNSSFSTAQSITSDNHSSCSSVMRRKVSRKKSDGVRIFDETIDTESQISDITHLENQLYQLPTTSKLSNITSGSNNPLPAFIRSSKSYLQTRSYQKCDPVNRYHQFKQEWELNKVPGESNHSSERWKMKEQMLKVNDIERPRHNYSSNKYVVPTEKKRQALRWQIRSAMAQIH
ncbi:centriolar and ciliogenesis-associated protein HYLS1 isoform X2 [Hydra vulgaris]|uniref:Centriolar and ciliogenesis-associated protein HYLS1 isoform X2 n=1 Tax=Hydra vulgaris TaxID=6087 RepID=A0ABM4CJQ2_HYDVU